MPKDVRRFMGPSKSQSHTLEAIGHAEDFSQIITNIDPDSTFFLNEFGDAEDAVELDFGWLTEGLRPPKVNAHFEKEDYRSHEVGSLEGLHNHVQFFQSSGYVTNAQQKVKKMYNPQDEFSRLYKNVFTEHARDIEYMLCNGDIARPENGDRPALCGGIPYFMQVQNISATIAGGVVTTAEPHGLRTGDFVYFTGDSAAMEAAGLTQARMYFIRLEPPTGAGTPDPALVETQFTIYNTMKGAVEDVAVDKIEADLAECFIVKNNVVDLEGDKDFDIDDLNNIMQMCYNRGGNPTLAVMSPAKKRRFSSLVTALMQINRDADKTRKVDLVADAVETDFGVITAKAHRMYADNRIDLLDMQYWDKKWFERTHQVTGLPKKGTYKEFVIESSLGLKGTQPKASGSLLNIKR